MVHVCTEFLHALTDLPVLCLVCTVSVGLGKLALRVHRCNGSTELGHGVEGSWEVVDHLNHMLREVSATGPIPGDGPHLNTGEDNKSRDNIL